MNSSPPSPPAIAASRAVLAPCLRLNSSHTAGWAAILDAAGQGVGCLASSSAVTAAVTNRLASTVAAAHGLEFIVDNGHNGKQSALPLTAESHTVAERPAVHSLHPTTRTEEEDHAQVSNEEIMFQTVVFLCANRCWPTPGRIKNMAPLLYPRAPVFQNKQHWSADTIRLLCESSDQLEVLPGASTTEGFRVCPTDGTGVLSVDDPQSWFIDPKALTVPEDQFLEFEWFFGLDKFLGHRPTTSFRAALLLLKCKVGHLTDDSLFSEAEGIIDYAVRTKKLGYYKLGQESILLPLGLWKRAKLLASASEADKNFSVLRGQLQRLLEEKEVLDISEVKYWLQETQKVKLDEAAFGHEKLRVLLQDRRLHGICVVEGSSLLRPRADAVQS